MNYEIPYQILTMRYKIQDTNYEIQDTNYEQHDKRDDIKNSARAI
jgi:hypothetical protein